MLNSVLWNIHITIKYKLKIYNSIKVLSHMELKHGNLTKIRIKTYADGNGLF